MIDITVEEKGLRQTHVIGEVVELRLITGIIGEVMELGKQQVRSWD